ncbi:hypothetical protein ACE1BH_22340, partial [Aeromonas jandaei]
LGGTTNISELLINVVTYNKPKMLTGLNQKGTRLVVSSRMGTHGHQTVGEQAESKPPMLTKWNMVSPYYCL